VLPTANDSHRLPKNNHRRFALDIAAALRE